MASNKDHKDKFCWPSIKWTVVIFGHFSVWKWSRKEKLSFWPNIPALGLQIQFSARIHWYVNFYLESKLKKLSLKYDQIDQNLRDRFHKWTFNVSNRYQTLYELDHFSLWFLHPALNNIICVYLLRLFIYSVNLNHVVGMTGVNQSNRLPLQDARLGSSKNVFNLDLKFSARPRSFNVPIATLIEPIFFNPVPTLNEVVDEIAIYCHLVLDISLAFLQVFFVNDNCIWRAFRINLNGTILWSLSYHRVCHSGSSWLVADQSYIRLRTFEFNPTIFKTDRPLILVIMSVNQL